MEADGLHQLLIAEIALELGFMTQDEAVCALARCKESGGRLLDGLEDDARERTQAAVATLLDEVGGDALAVLAQRGVERRTLNASLAPETAQRLFDSGTRIRTPLRTLDRDRYTGLLPLGQGGMGVVYVAVDTELNRRVALKMMRLGRTDLHDPTPVPIPPELEARFLQEAWVTGGLEHPGIIPVYELGRFASGAPYYTMRLVRGERTLADAIEGATEPEARLALLEPFLKICDAIRYAHSRGVVHRDLKPANVALGEFGEVVVLDWGLARTGDRTEGSDSLLETRIRELRSDSNLETVAGALGTPGYMAPEAALGEVGTVDARSDVFSLGAILFRILTGRQPFAFASFAGFVEQVTSGVHEVAGAPPGLESICLSALAVDREARYADAGQLAHAIRAWRTQNVLEREVESLLGEARSALDAASDAHAAARLRHVDRAAAALEQVSTRQRENLAADAYRERAAALRERGIRERERATGRRLLLRTAAVVLVMATVTGVVVAGVLDRRRRDAEQARGEATAALGREQDARKQTQAALDEKGRALRQVLRLADAKRVGDLLTEVDALWPVHPDRAPAMADWLERARAVLANRADHEAALAALRERAEPYTEERRRRDGAVRTARLEVLRAELARPEEPTTDESERKEVAKRRAQRLEEVAKLEATIGGRASWSFANAEDDWRHQVLSDLRAGLDRLQAVLVRVRGRYEAARTLRTRSIDEHRAVWDRIVEAIAASPKYGGLRIAPQLALVPLGPDPDSGLFEFAHLGTGAIPQRDTPTGRLVLTDDFALILILVPGGTFAMGAQKTDPSGPNYDPDANDDESPVRDVTLTPYFLSKYECSQAQWEKLTAKRPSTYGPDTGKGSDRNPVEGISWWDCSLWLARYGLQLPTEAQWEYACRAGTNTPWFTGRDVKALEKVANIADAYCAANSGKPSWNYTMEVNDGFVVHAPVGSFAPNAFGFYDVHGNVWEWCRDTHRAYPAEAVTDPVGEGAGYRVFRGGTWIAVASLARCSYRYTYDPAFLSNFLGVRPARSITSE